MARFKSSRVLLATLLTGTAVLALSSCAVPRAHAQEDATLFGFKAVQYSEREPLLRCVRRPCQGGWGWVFNFYVCYCVYRPDLYARGMR